MKLYSFIISRSYLIEKHLKKAGVTVKCTKFAFNVST